MNHAGVLDGDVRFCLVLPREALSVPVMRRVLGGTLLGFGADEECVADILLAASEACTNVLKYGGRSAEYEILASVGRNDCLLEIANGASSHGARPGAHLDGLRPRPGGKTPGRDRANGRAGTTGESGTDVSPDLSGPADGSGGTPGPAASGPADGSGGTPGPAGAAAPTTAGAPAGHDARLIQESGRGLTIMRACMDDLTLRGIRGRGTVVLMRKQMTWAPAVHGRHAGPPGARPAHRLRDAG